MTECSPWFLTHFLTCLPDPTLQLPSSKSSHLLTSMTRLTSVGLGIWGALCLCVCVYPGEGEHPTVEPASHHCCPQCVQLGERHVRESSACLRWPTALDSGSRHRSSDLAVCPLLFPFRAVPIRTELADNKISKRIGLDLNKGYSNNDRIRISAHFSSIQRELGQSTAFSH